MIFNINSTRGQTRFLTCVARVTCLVLINYNNNQTFHAGQLCHQSHLQS